MTVDIIERYQGCLLGLAVGDALGTTLEFQPPGSFAPITDMVGGGPFHLKAGQWTDDTSLALCLAESLIECRGFNPQDQMERYVRWWKEGHLSSTGACFDIGGTTRTALLAFLKTGIPGKRLCRQIAGSVPLAFYRSDTFEEGCLLAVNLGDDADTTGAIYGQLAGASS